MLHFETGFLPGRVAPEGPGLASKADQCEHRHVAGDLIVYAKALLALTLLVFIMRWVFTTSRPSTGRKEHGPNADLGMLRPVLASASRHDAVEAKALLSGNGIRCSLSRIDFEHFDLLVFADDVERATSLLEQAR